MNKGFAALESKYTGLELEEMYDINGGITIIIAGVAVVLTAKAIAAGVGIVSAIIGGVYSLGYVLGKGWAYVK
ncbi:hypothetical protein JZO86_10325 [Enterococcus ureasiticus]|uniref:hypothetical protein n=1 Tax=Enterococcus ureasiticus TaxID=903984 RepID=UPI001A8DD8E2|nr:hypothetical protein [Enterococcus ureasiticus]MBO0474095.1 hypothetical protein [Enterococcus ureasiticus]